MRLRQRHLRMRSVGANLELDARSLTVADGANVTTWTDTSGNSNSADNASGISVPILRRNSINGQPAVEFISKRNSIANSFSSDCIFVVVDLASDVNHGIIGNFIGAGGWTNLAVGFHSGSYKFAYIGSESWNLLGEYVFADRVFWNGTNSTNGDANAGIAVYDRNSRAAYTYPGSYGIAIGYQQASFTDMEGVIGIIISLPASPSDSLRKKIEKALAYRFKIRCS